MVAFNFKKELKNQRVNTVKPLIPPQLLIEDLPMSIKAAATVYQGRQDAENIIKGIDDRLLVVVGPCSINDTRAGLEYAMRLVEYKKTAKNDLLIIMRVYFEKPRTSVGWKGLINDPYLNGSYNINNGLRIARQLLLDINEMGIPAGCEFLDTIIPQYTADLVSFGAIGARTTESQIHRELASGLSCPIGFKNSTDGGIDVAVDAIKAASQGHHFLSVTQQGVSAIVESFGNDSCHIILRGGKNGPNYSAEHVYSAAEKLVQNKLKPSIIIDCSHGNSSKDHKRQPIVADDIAKQLSNPQKTGKYIKGVMIESNLVEGRQDIPREGAQKLVYGKSVTDACIDWEDTVKTLDGLRRGVRARRAARQ